jgi:hypothetical protein
MSPLTRRAAVIAVAVVGLVAAPVASYAHTVGYPTTIKSGRWHGMKWKVTARTGSDGSYCIDMEISGRLDGRSCGSIRDRGSRGISYMAHWGRPTPNYVIGPVIAKARSVHIRFFDRPPIRISTIAPPRTPELDRGIRFFTVILPCPATPRSLVARDAAGRVVAQIIRARPGVPRASC